MFKRMLWLALDKWYKLLNFFNPNHVIEIPVKKAETLEVGSGGTQEVPWAKFHEELRERGI
jgi:hypothetical protein